MDAVEIIVAWVGVTDDIPFVPRAIADGADGRAGVGPEQIGNLARVSNVQVSILMRGRGI